MSLAKTPKTSVPREAHAIAARFRLAAGRIRGLAADLRSTSATLNDNWKGNAKNLFSAAFDPEPGRMDDFADWLEDRARFIESISVTVWE